MSAPRLRGEARNINARFAVVLGFLLVCRFVARASDAGVGGRGRQASDKRQGTKSRGGGSRQSRGRVRRAACFGPAEWLLGVDHPLGLAQRFETVIEGGPIGESPIVGEEPETAGGVRGEQHLEEE